MTVAEPAPSFAEAIADEVLSIDDEQQRALLMSQLSDDDFATVERAIAQRVALGWRATPVTMGHYLTRPERTLRWGPVIKLWRYSLHLGEKFRQLVTRESTRQIWNIEARYGKSLIGSRWGPAWALDFDPTLAVMLSSYGDTLADENADAVRQILRIYSDVLRVQLRPDRQARSRFLTDQGGGLVAAGLDAGLSGFPADIGVLDDPFKNWQEAHSEARREHVENQYRAVIRLRAETDDAGILVIHNRWHEDDLTGRLVKQMEDGTGEQWDVVRLPTVAQEPNPRGPRIYAMPDPLGRKPGELLEPERFSEAGVAARALALGSYLWSAVGLQQPSPEEGNDVKRSWFRIEDRLPTRADEWLSSWDTKMKDKEGGDFVVGQMWARTGKDCWLMDQLRGQWDRPTTVAAVCLLAVRWPACRRHAVEAAALGPEVKQDLAKPTPGFVLSDDVAGQLGMTDDEREAVQAMRRRGLGGVVLNPVKGDKRARLRLVTPYIEAGDVHVWEHATYLASYLDELTAFPNGTHDDQCDTTSQALAILHRHSLRNRKLSGEQQRDAAASSV